MQNFIQRSQDLQVVYRGNPFIVEAGVAYGGGQNAEESMHFVKVC